MLFSVQNRLNKCIYTPTPRSGVTINLTFLVLTNGHWCLSKHSGQCVRFASQLFSIYTNKDHKYCKRQERRIEAWIVGFLTSSSTTWLYRGRIPRLTSDNFTCCHTRDRAGRPWLLSQMVTLYRHRPNK